MWLLSDLEMAGKVFITTVLLAGGVSYAAGLVLRLTWCRQCKGLFRTGPQDGPMMWKICINCRVAEEIEKAAGLREHTTGDLETLKKELVAQAVKDMDDAMKRMRTAFGKWK